MMAHIHKLFDFVVTACIVYDNKILLVHHKKMNGWLPIGGHIELDEDPETALFREIEEECGLKREQLTVLSEKPKVELKQATLLYRPNFLDVHPIMEDHQHIGLVYILKSSTDQVNLADKEHNQIKWFSLDELADLNLKDGAAFVTHQALKQAKM